MSLESSGTCVDRLLDRRFQVAFNVASIFHLAEGHRADLVALALITQGLPAESIRGLAQ